MNIFYLWRLWLSSKPANISFFTYEHLSNYQANLLFGLSSCPELSNVLCCNRDFGNYQVYVNQTLQQVITKVVATRTNKGIPYTQNRTLYAAHTCEYIRQKQTQNMLCSATKFNIQMLHFNHIAQSKLETESDNKVHKAFKTMPRIINYTIVRAKDLDGSLFARATYS